MRLINVNTLRLEEFWDGQTPPYAILSHTWEEGEVSYQDFLDPTIASQKRGYSKIFGACEEAKKDNLGYVWVDTNCIDKTSSAELSEAINSMFHWYQNSEVCYAYLCDVPDPDNWTFDFGQGCLEDVLSQTFVSSRWFTRGWTLQELLAPRKLQFYTSGWKPIFRDRGGELNHIIAGITKIDVDYLFGARSLGSASVACKMSWISRRKTTRREDMAYCMLGLFGINMPLLYGEGDKAFVRLQEEILKSSTDHTLFCWTWTESVPVTWTSMLAPGPQAFELSGGFVEYCTAGTGPLPYQMTNYGLSITLPYVQCWSYGLLMLNARDARKAPNPGDLNGFPNQSKVCIPVRARHSGSGIFNREPFPPAPMPFPIVHSRFTKHVIVRAQPDPFPIDRLPVPASAGAAEHGFLVSVQDTLMLLETDSPYYSRWREAPSNRVLQQVSRVVGFESSPPGCFDAYRSVFWLRRHTSCSHGLLRIGRRSPEDVTNRCILYFRVAHRRAFGCNFAEDVFDGDGYNWSCRAIDAGVWRDGDVDFSPEYLLRRLIEYSQKETTNRLSLEDWEDGLYAEFTADTSRYQVELGPVLQNTSSGAKVRIVSVVDKAIHDLAAVAEDQDHDAEVGYYYGNENSSDVSIVAQADLEAYNNAR